MKSLLALGVSLLGLSHTFVEGTPVRAERLAHPVSLEERGAEPEVVHLEQRQAASPPSCTHGPTNRGCWTGGFSINTNQYISWPNTGVIRDVSAHLPLTSLR